MTTSEVLTDTQARIERFSAGRLNPDQRSKMKPRSGEILQSAMFSDPHTSLMEEAGFVLRYRCQYGRPEHRGHRTVFCTVHVSGSGWDVVELFKPLEVAPVLPEPSRFVKVAKSPAPTKPKVLFVETPRRDLTLSKNDSCFKILHPDGHVMATSDTLEDASRIANALGLDKGFRVLRRYLNGLGDGYGPENVARPPRNPAPTPTTEPESTATPTKLYVIVSLPDKKRCPDFEPMSYKEAIATTRSLNRFVAHVTLQAIED